jgi:hypothetical protein
LYLSYLNGTGLSLCLGLHLNTVGLLLWLVWHQEILRADLLVLLLLFFFLLNEVFILPWDICVFRKL